MIMAFPSFKKFGSGFHYSLFKLRLKPSFKRAQTNRSILNAKNKYRFACILKKSTIIFVITKQDKMKNLMCMMNMMMWGKPTACSIA